MLSPETFPVNSNVSGIGLVMETFQATSSPLAVPSKISAELPSAPWVPVSTPPEFLRVSVAWRSPIGVLMVMFQLPSTAIMVSRASRKPEWFSVQAFFGGIADLAAEQNLDQARAARIRSVTSTRNATYCIANAANLAPSSTNDT